MHGGSIMETAQVIWGMDAKILATAIMMLSYVALFTETLNRRCGGFDWCIGDDFCRCFDPTTGHYGRGL